jgi:hypothetical protein
VVAIKTLLPELRKQVRALSEDLLERSTKDSRIDAGLRQAFEQIEKGGRTAHAFQVWRDDYLDQVAVAWVLACVFVRFLEDNHLIDECWLAGEGDRRNLAEDTHELFFREHPHNTDREYFQHVFREVGKIPAAKDLFAEGKTPLWAVGPSGDAAMGLLKFWREIDAETGRLQRSFEVENGDTRFLGDLYQELSERAKKKYALLQTPVFVEEFILDRTLTPALAEFGLEKVRMIDPTCGSGHFLLGGFARLFRLWSERESNEIKAAQNALDGVWGVDINPFAVAIARFRLIVAAVQACGIKRLKEAPGWNVHLATGDTLLFGRRWRIDGVSVGTERFLDESWAPSIYYCEEQDALNEILGQQYHVVVGNPPYITPKDRACNDAYRRRYLTAYDKYHLSTPLTERFFELAISESSNASAGYIGMISDNAFMKRDYGIRLVEEFLPKVDLTHLIDTSGAYIPGHGTPTVILIGRNRKPVGDVRAVLGIKGEPKTPEDPSRGAVWQSILSQIDRSGTQDEFTSSVDLPRSHLSSHPWSIGGGGANELVLQLEENSSHTLAQEVESIGITSFTLEDDVYILPSRAVDRLGLEPLHLREMVVGDMLRDWIASACDPAVFPYDQQNFSLVDEDFGLPLFKYLWGFRTNLATSKMFGGKTKVQSGLRWYEYGRLTDHKLSRPLSIAFAFVATHNHFVLDRGGKVFKQSAPIIKLPAEATESDHLGLLGLLNSSTACFWMKQTFHNKGSTVDQAGARQRTDPFEDFFEFTGTGLQRFPVPESRSLGLARQLDEQARKLDALHPEAITATDLPTRARLDESRQLTAKIRSRMISLQEELDWHCYRLYSLLSDDLRYSGANVPEVSLGERAFEIVMARQIAKGALETTWFERHGSTPITEIPSQWPDAYRRLVERRIDVIQTNKEIALIEKPEYKRRWNTEPWEEQEARVLENWLLDRLETPAYRKGTKEHPEVTTTAQMSDVASADKDFLQVAELYRKRPDFDVAALVAELVEAESVPFLPILRYKPSGLRKRELWERTWDLQRQEDAGQKVDDIPVPPKYATADFLKADYWRLRGKLDVPKERWISYPHCSTDSDPTLVIGWAGWNHLEQATALVAYYDGRKREGWDAKRLTPLLAGLDQLLPWIHQWHPEVDPQFGEPAGVSFQRLLEDDAHELGLTLEDIRNWTPPERSSRKRKARA